MTSLIEDSQYFRHPMSLVEAKRIGRGSRIWAFAHVLPGAIIGEDCNICDHVFIENDVVIGDRVTVKSGVQLWDGVTLEDDVFIGPNATFTNDAFPRSKHYPGRFARTLVRRGASIGANATLLPGIIIGAGAMIGAGSVVTKDVPDGAVMAGNPARVLRLLVRNESHTPAEMAGAFRELRVAAVAVWPLPVIADERGSLVFAQEGTHLPFTPRRVFAITKVPAGQPRGEHAHRDLHQFFICLSGTVTLRFDDGRMTDEITLHDSTLGVHVAPMVWVGIHGLDPTTTLLVVASDVYREEDYIRDYDEFRRVAGPS